MKERMAKDTSETYDGGHVRPEQSLAGSVPCASAGPQLLMAREAMGGEAG